MQRTVLRGERIQISITDLYDFEGIFVLFDQELIDHGHSYQATIR